MTNIQPGWYQDPQDAAQKRWWDGTQWTDQVSGAAYSTEPTRVSVDTNTAFAWILAVLPLLSIVGVLVMNPRQYIGAAIQPDPSNPFAVFTPGYFASLGLSFAIWLVAVLLAFLDRRTLASRGLPRPFHWAWTFLSSWVYIIGRSVVIGRRTGVRNIGPLILFIVVNVVSVIVVFAILIDAVRYAMTLVSFS